MPKPEIYESRFPETGEGSPGEFFEFMEEEQPSVETLSEAVDVKAIIKELISTGWSGDNASQMKAVQLLKGLSTSEDPASNKFMKKLDTFTSGLKVEDF